jgi:hypothetical protein
MQQTKKRGAMNMRTKKVIMFLLNQSARQHKNQLRQAAMRMPQISRDICSRAVN